MAKFKNKKISKELLEAKNENEQFLYLNRKKKLRPDTKKIIDIYRNHGKSIDMTKIERKDPNRRKKILFLIIFILIIILAATLAGFYFFTKHEKKFSEEDIKIEINVPDKIVSGQETSIFINCINNSKIDLTKAELTVILSEGFNFLLSEPRPANELNNIWQLGEVKSDKKKGVEIKGQFIGDVGSTSTIDISLTYVPANFNSEFSKKSSRTVVIKSSVLDVEIEAAIRTISGKELSYSIKYKNNSSGDIERIKIEADYPQEFSFISAEPAASEANKIWIIDNVVKNQEGEIKIKGLLYGNAGEMKEFKANIGYLDKSNNFQSQAESTSLILIVNPQLYLTIIINDSSKNETADFGQILDYKIKYQNDSEMEIQDLVIFCELTSEVLDWSSLIDTNDGLVEENKITWSKSKISGLEKVKQGEGGEITFSIKTKDNITATDDSEKNYTIVSLAKAVSEKVTDLESTKLEIESNVITTKINTKLELLNEARYYNDEYLQVGTGQIPPQVGKTTNYRIYWHLTNTTNEVSEVIVKTELPENVIWTGKTGITAGANLEFDPDTREVTWSINKIPVYVGSLHPELEANFEVSVTPVEDDIGKILFLTEKTILTGHDQFTENDIETTKELLTSELINDPLAKGKGIVVGSNTNSFENLNSNFSANVNI